MTGRPVRWWGWAAVAVALALVSVGLAHQGDRGGGRSAAAPTPVATPSPTTSPPAEVTTAPPALPSTDPPRAPVEAAPLPTGIVPARLIIEAIGVDAPTVGLDLRGAEPEVPADDASTGWYHQTRRPGEIGPAVIAGHVDGRSGPAVFFRLGELAPGDEILVESADGDRRAFVVTGSGQHPKGELPPEVFGFGAATPELRLITCGGAFDRSSGHYLDNLVVYARAA